MSSATEGKVRSRRPPAHARTVPYPVWDLRAEKIFRFGGRSLSGLMDIYNITNSNAEFRQINISGGSFGFPTTIVPPRVIR